MYLFVGDAHPGDSGMHFFASWLLFVAQLKCTFVFVRGGVLSGCL
jgi:hypothetical protein